MYIHPNSTKTQLKSSQAPVPERAAQAIVDNDPKIFSYAPDSENA